MNAFMQRSACAWEHKTNLCASGHMDWVRTNSHYPPLRMCCTSETVHAHMRHLAMSWRSLHRIEKIDVAVRPQCVLSRARETRTLAPREIVNQPVVQPAIFGHRIPDARKPACRALDFGIDDAAR